VHWTPHLDDDETLAASKYRQLLGRVFNKKSFSDLSLNNIEWAREPGYAAASQPLAVADYARLRPCSIKTDFLLSIEQRHVTPGWVSSATLTLTETSCWSSRGRAGSSCISIGDGAVFWTS
jgi:hypothetical protein